MRPWFLQRSVLSWAFYDWANSAFATTVLAGFFPLFFKEYWAADLEVADSTFWLGSANSFASLLMVLTAPVLGALADANGQLKRYLAFFALLGICSTATFFWMPSGAWTWALVLFVMGIVGFAAANLYYDALLPKVAHDGLLDRVSALGFGMGYLGGGLLFTLNIAMVTWPGLFGLTDMTAAVRWSFLSVALWWLVFSIPLLRWVRVPVLPHHARPLGQSLSAGVARVVRTVREVRQHRNVGIFLVAYWLYIDGVDTVVRMAVDYGLSIGLGAQHLMVALLVTQLVGFPSALVFGELGGRIGPRRGIFIGLGVYLAITLWAYRMQSVWEFYVLAVSVGLVQGGVQALSRSLYVRLIPRERAGEFFGFYNMMGKFAAVIGPFMVGLVAAVTRDNRLSILSVSLLFLLGGLFLWRVREPEN
ncbi:MAG: MFS transporter [Pseudomonadota bacterium]